MLTRPQLLAGLIVLALISAGCTSSGWIVRGPELLSQAALETQPAPSAWDFPRGRFSAVGSPSVVLLAIENDGSYRIYRDNALLDTGKFEVVGAQVMVDSLACARRGYKPAAYAWLYDSEQTLGFEGTGSDLCPERQQYLADAYQPRYAFAFVPRSLHASGTQS